MANQACFPRVHVCRNHPDSDRSCHRLLRMAAISDRFRLARLRCHIPARSRIDPVDIDLACNAFHL